MNGYDILNGATGTFGGAVNIANGGITIESHNNAPSSGATFKDTVTAKYVTTNGNAGTNVFEHAVTLTGYNVVEENIPYEHVPGTYALGIGGGNNTLAEVTIDSSAGNIIIGGGQTKFTGAVASAAGIYIGGENTKAIFENNVTAGAGGISLYDTSSEFKGTIETTQFHVQRTKDVAINLDVEKAITVSGSGQYDGLFILQFDHDAGTPEYVATGSAVFNGIITAKQMDISNATLNTSFNNDVILHGGMSADDLSPFTLSISGPGNTTFKNITATSTADSGALFMSQGEWDTSVAINGTAAFSGKMHIGQDEELLPLFGGTPEALAAMGATTLTLGNGSSLSATNGINIANKGTLALTGNASATGDLTFKSGSTFAIDAKYKLTVSGATDIQTGAVANVQNVDSIEAVGRTILTSGGGITGQFGASGLYKVESDGTDLKITGLNRVEDILAENNIVTGNSAAAGAMTSSILSGATTATPELRLNLNNAIGNITALAATNPGLAKAATAQLFGEHGVTGVTASQTTAQNFSGSVGNHQTQLRDNSQASAAPASANSTTAFASLRGTRQGYSSFNPNRIWGGGFGAWTRQDDKNNQSGYKYNSGGFILGYDREFGVSPTGSFVAGLSSAYSAGEIENNDGFTTTDVDTFNVGVYASYNHCSGFFADVNAGFGFSWNDVDTVDIIATGHKTGEYDTTSFQLGGTVGYAVTLPQEFRFIPSVGLQFNHVNQDAWSERTQNAAQIANSFGETNSNSLSIPVQVRVNKTFHLGNGASITPEVRGAWIYEAKNPQAQVRMGYVGSSASTTLYGIDVGRSRGLVGAGVKMKFGKADAFVDYNYEFRSGYKNHNVMAGLGLSF